MSTSSAAALVKKSVGLSIGLSVLMIVAGVLAIAIPQVAGIAMNLLVAWLASIRWSYNAYPRRPDLEDLAIEHRMGDWHTGEYQHAVQRRFSPHAISGRARRHQQDGLGLEQHANRLIQPLRALAGFPRPPSGLGELCLNSLLSAGAAPT
jgi:hypothetical protein